ncbi:MAG: Maf family protein [Methylophilaceae bacterium]|nr:Maf family protein [Methylophilaceae bacterium]
MPLPEQTKIIHSPAHMKKPLILASSSPTREKILRAAGLVFTAQSPRIDEDAIRITLKSEGAHPRDIADALAEMKARKIADRNPDALVLGCDQVLEFDGQAWGKAETVAEAHTQLVALRGQPHHLFSALVLFDEGRPIWRHIGKATLTMREFSDIWLDDYLTRNWESIRHSVGGYMLEEEGIRLFTAVEGDYFTILGLPLLPLLAYLGQRGFIAI